MLNNEIIQLIIRNIFTKNMTTTLLQNTQKQKMKCSMCGLSGHIMTNKKYHTNEEQKNFKEKEKEKRNKLQEEKTLKREKEKRIKEEKRKIKEREIELKREKRERQKLLNIRRKFLKEIIERQKKINKKKLHNNSETNLENNIENIENNIENNIGNNLGNNKSNIKNKGIKNEKNFIFRFNTNDDYKIEVLNYIKKIGININKYTEWKAYDTKGKNIKITDEFKELKGCRNYYSPPKTDVYLSDGNREINLSIKSGPGRPTSSNYYETKAIFLSVINSNPKYLEDDKLNELVNNLFDNLNKQKFYIKQRISIIEGEEVRLDFTWTNMKDKYFNKKNNKHYELYVEKFNKEFEIFNKFQNSINKCNELWDEIKSKYYDFINDIIIECLRGKLKFSNNLGQAQILLVLKNTKTTDILNMINLIQYDNITLVHHCKMENGYLNIEDKKLIDYCLSINTNTVFATKSSKGNKSKRCIWLRFL